MTKEFTTWHIYPIWPITTFNVKFSHPFISNSIFFLLHKQNKTTEPGTDIFILKAKAQNFLCCNLFYLFLKCFPFCLYISKQLILLEKPEAFKKTVSKCLSLRLWEMNNYAIVFVREKCFPLIWLHKQGLQLAASTGRMRRLRGGMGFAYKEHQLEGWPQITASCFKCDTNAQAP